MDHRTTLKRICEAIEDKKGDRIVVLDVSNISSFADFFILCNGYNQRQNQAICDAVKEKMKIEESKLPSHIEGYNDADWILMDYLDCIVHIFSPDAREFYKLERLWNDGIRMEAAALIA